MLLRATLVSLPALAVACGKDSESNSGGHGNGAHGGTGATAGEAGDNGTGGSGAHGGTMTGGRGGSGTAAAAGDGDDLPGGAPGKGGSGGSDGGTGARGGSGARGGTGPRGGTGGDTTSEAGSDAGGSPAAGEPGTGGTATGGAGTGGTGTGGTIQGTGGAAGEGPTEHGLYVGTTGSDTNSGTREHPFATLAHAASLAESGETITFLDGTFVTTSTATAITIKSGVDIVAENPGAVTLQSTGGALVDLLGTTHITGITFTGFATPIRAASVNGVVTLSRFTFLTCASATTPAVEASSGATVYLLGTGSATWSHCSTIAHASGTATLNVQDGAIEYPAAASAAAFKLDGESTLEVLDLDATAGGASFATISGTAYAKVHDSGVRTNGAPGFVMHEDASLHFHGSELSIAPSSAIYPCVDSQMSGAGSIAILDSGVHGCSAAVSGTAATTTVDESEIYDMGVAGLDLSGTGGVSVTDSWFHDTAAAGIWLGSAPGTNAFELVLRGTRVEGATSGIILDGSDASTWDLGTLAEPGSNILLGTTSLTVMATGFVSAVSNTWHANAQGADAGGLYSAGGAPGAVLEVTSGTGVNYNDSGGATIRLAQNAP